MKHSIFLYFQSVKLLTHIFLLLILLSCSLNADQEASLHQATISYINARNEGVATAVVAYTYPPAVAYYTGKGDSIFKARFDLSNLEEEAFLQDGNIEAIEKKDSEIHVKYSYLSIDPFDFKSDKVFIYAMSSNYGESWFYLDEGDYRNEEILPSSKRLIK